MPLGICLRLDYAWRIVRVLAITKIFPNRADMEKAPYNRVQLGTLSARATVEVVATIPWLPGRAMLGGAPVDQAPAHDEIDGMPTMHPKVLYGPKVARSLSGPLYAASLLPWLRGHRGQHDVVLGCFGYPDGWAAAAVASALGLPVVIKVHGTDVNVLGEDPLVRPLLSQAFRRAYAVVGPSQPLIDRAVALGANPDTSRMVRNGTDRALFKPRDRARCRRELGHGGDERPWIVFVGHLSHAKGAVDLLHAFRRMRRPGVRLVLVGGGGRRAQETRVREEAEGLDVLFAGSRPLEEVRLWIGASNLLTLPSHAEGTPNVVLEALASGRRVVATAVGGIPAVVTDPVLGTLVPAHDRAALAEALSEALDTDYDPEEVSRRAPVISWRASADALYEVLESAVRDG